MPRSRLALFSPLVVVALVGVLTGCGHDQEYRRNFELPEDLRLLRIRISTGELNLGAHEGDRQLRVEGRVRRVAAAAEDQAKLDALAFDLELRVTEEPGVYLLRTPELPAGIDPSRSALVFRSGMSIPQGVAVDVETGTGELRAQDVAADLSMRTGRGEISLVRVSGYARVATGDGKVFVMDHRGGLEASSGDPERPHLTGESIWAKVLELGPQGIRLRTNGTSIALYLPPESHFDLDAEVGTSQTGKLGIRTGFGLPVEGRGAGHVSVGKVGGGGPKVELRLLRGWMSLGRIGEE